MQKAYEDAFAAYHEEMKTFCTKRGVDYVTLSTDMPLEKVLFNELLKVGIMA